jgi:transposase InsO family protein
MGRRPTFRSPKCARGWRRPHPATTTGARGQRRPPPNAGDYLTALITKVFTDSHGTYGYRRVHAQLARWGEHASPELVRALMRAADLVPCQPRPFRPVTPLGDPAAAATPDLVRRDFTADAPGTKLVGDITYIETWEGWLYLATVIDCHTKAVVGWAMAEHMKASLVRDAIEMAATNVAVTPGCIFHSDRGTQFGHSTVGYTLQTYTHTVPGMDQEAADRVARLIFPAAASGPEPSPADGGDPS